MRVFLTGASGYLGGVLTERLLAESWVDGVTGIGLRPTPNVDSRKLRFVTMDVRSPAMAQAMKDHDAVIHAAAVVLWPARMSVAERDDINLNGTGNVARAAREAGIRHFVHTSSMAVYDPHRARGASQIDEDFPKGGDDRFFYYWSTKANAERIVRETLAGSALRATYLRPIYIIGPRNRVTIRGLRANAVRFPGYDPRRQFIHENDVADAFLHVLRHGIEGAYNVVPDDYMRMSEVWPVVGAKRVLPVPVGVARWTTWVRWRFLGSPIHPSWVQDILVDFTGSNAKLVATGWRPSHRSEEALRLAAAAS